MDNFIFYSPTKFVFGKDTESQAGNMVKEFGGVHPNPLDTLVYEGIELCKEDKYDL